MTSMTKWEYKTFGAEADINNLGAQGWELVAVSRNRDFSEVLVFYFKRPVAPEPQDAEKLCGCCPIHPGH